jgi:hypothetical protein
MGFAGRGFKSRDVEKPKKTPALAAEVLPSPDARVFIRWLGSVEILHETVGSAFGATQLL